MGTGMRILHNYRNISRACKQFMMGDRFLEQLMICQLRDHFFRPMHYNAPIENTFFMGRSLADLSDRHYSLFANNQHPIQLSTYQYYNSFLRDLHDKKEAETQEDLAARFDQVVEEREAGLRSRVSTVTTLTCPCKPETRPATSAITSSLDVHLV